MNTDKGCGGVAKGERLSAPWPYEMEVTGEEEESQEEYFLVKDHELLNGVSDFYNNSKLSDINLTVGDQKWDFAKILLYIKHVLYKNTYHMIFVQLSWQDRQILVAIWNNCIFWLNQLFQDYNIIIVYTW